MSIHLTTRRLTIRPYTAADLRARHALTQEAFNPAATLDSTQAWLNWTLANYTQLAALHQPPYGDYAIAITETGEGVGSVGVVPSVVPWAVFPAFDGEPTLISPEFGLFYAVRAAHRGQQYATEAARALMNFMFRVWGARRVVATTEHTNLASQRVMVKLGMRLYRNPGSDPHWLQVVGVRQHRDLQGSPLYY